MKLNCAEAVAATLWICGLPDDARIVLSKFSYGDEFIKINLDLLNAYAAATDSADVVRIQNERLAEMRAVAAGPTERPLYPPSDSESERDSSDAEDGSDDGESRPIWGVVRSGGGGGGDSGGDAGSEDDRETAARPDVVEGSSGDASMRVTEDMMEKWKIDAAAADEAGSDEEAEVASGSDEPKA